MPDAPLMNPSSCRSLQTHGSQHRVEVVLAVFVPVQDTCATIRWIVAAAIHDARRAIDEPHVRTAHSTIDPGLQLVDVVVCAGVPVFSGSRGVSLHRVQPVEEASDPLELWGATRRTDRIRVGAEVDLREQSIPAFSSSSLAQIVIQLAEIANSRRLDDAAAPPAASLQIRASFWLPEEWRCWVGAPLAVAELPATCLLTLVVLASPCLIDISKVCVQVDIGPVEFLATCGAPTPIVPSGRLRNLGLGSTEHVRRRPIPICPRVRAELHVRIHRAGHLAPSQLVLLRRALVVLVGLLQLAASGSRGIDGPTGLLHRPSVTPVVLIAGIVLDRLFHALRKESRDVDETIHRVVP